MSLHRLILLAFFLSTAAFTVPGTAGALVFEPSPGGSLTGPGYSNEVETGDIDADGDDDLVVGARPGSGGGGGLYVWLSDGDGTFTQAAESPLHPGSSVINVKIGQLDPENDSRLDLVAFVGEDSTFETLRGDGDGTFTSAGLTDLGTTPVTGRSTVSLGDLNGDDILDVSAAGLPNVVSAAINDGQGQFTPAIPQTVSGATNLDSLAYGDFDGDGNGDLAISNSSPLAPAKWGVYGLKGQGDGTFSNVAGNPFILKGYYSDPPYGVLSIASTDLNRDGLGDLIASIQNLEGDYNPRIRSLPGDSSAFFLNDGAGSIPAGDSPENVFVGDVNGDDRQDAGTGNFGDGNVTVGIANGDLASQIGGLYEEYDSPFTLGAAPGGKTYFPQKPATGDFNGDGGPDIAVTSSAGNAGAFLGVVVLLARPDLRFSGTAIDFGDEPIRPFIPASQGLEVTNEGTVGTSLTNFQISGPDASQFKVNYVADNCASLAFGRGICSFGVTFNPDLAGEKRATLSIDQGNSPEPVIFPISGNATPESKPRITITPGALNFGKATAGTAKETREITISSVGERNLQIGARLVGSDSSDFTFDIGTCSVGLLPPGESCVMSAGFKPESAGLKQAAIEIGHNAFAGEYFELTGEAVTPATLAVRGARKARRGGRLKVTSVIRNAGLEPLTNVVLTTRVPGSLARKPAKVRIPAIPVGETVKRTIRVAVRKQAKHGKKLTVRVGAATGTRVLASARLVARVR